MKEITHHNLSSLRWQNLRACKVTRQNTNRKRLENNKYSQQKDTAYITAGTDKAEQKGKS